MKNVTKSSPKTGRPRSKQSEEEFKKKVAKLSDLVLNPDNAPSHGLFSHTPQGPRSMLDVVQSVTESRKTVRETSPMPTLKMCEELPNPPEWLQDSRAIDMWWSVGQNLVESRMLPEDGLAAFGVMCALSGAIFSVFSKGEVPHPSVIGQFRGFVNDFGLTPAAHAAARAKIYEQTKETKQVNRFSQVGRRK